MVGTPVASPTANGLTSTQEPEASEGPASNGHPDRHLIARRNAMKARRLILGVKRGDQPRP
jgi:hypothetical protein